MLDEEPAEVPESCVGAFYDLTSFVVYELAVLALEAIS